MGINRTETRDWPVEEIDAVMVNAPEGYIGGKIYPVLDIQQKAGKIYYRALQANSAAQTNRSAGSAPTAVVIADASVDFSATEMIKRYGRDENAVSLFGGIEALDKGGAQAAMRSVFRGIEDLQAAKLVSAARYAAADDISDALIDGIIAGAQAVKRYKGRLAFVCSVSVYRWIIQQDEIKALLGRSITGLTPAQAMSLSPEVFKAALQGIFSFDEVLVGDDDHWSLTGMEDAAAICKLPPPELESHELDPVLGKTAVYTPGDGNMFSLRSHFDEDKLLNTYDAKSWLNVIEFNSAAAVLVKGLATAST